jgi:hypothetical protein
VLVTLGGGAIVARSALQISWCWGNAVHELFAAGQEQLQGQLGLRGLARSPFSLVRNCLLYAMLHAFMCCACCLLSLPPCSERASLEGDAVKAADMKRVIHYM